MNLPPVRGTVQSHSQEEEGRMNGFLRIRVTSNCGNGRPQEGDGGASKGGGNGIIQDGEM